MAGVNGEEVGTELPSSTVSGDRAGSGGIRLSIWRLRISPNVSILSFPFPLSLPSLPAPISLSLPIPDRRLLLALHLICTTPSLVTFLCLLYYPRFVLLPHNNKDNNNSFFFFIASTLLFSSSFIS